MREWIRSFGRRYHRWRSTRRRLTVEWLEDLPERTRKDRIYVVGGRAHPWQVVFRCPCGCRQMVYVGVAASLARRWRLVEHMDGTLSLSPSVWRSEGCRSHFFLRRGRIKWC